MDDRLLAKLISIFGLLAIPLVFCFIPVKLIRYCKWRAGRDSAALRVVDCLTSICAGYFLGAFLLLMLPGCQDLINRSILAPAGITYPLATLVIGISFFFVVFLEEGILAVNFRRSPDEDVEIFNGREMEKRQQRDDESDRFLLDDSDSKGKETSAEYGSMKEPTSGIVTDAAHHLSPGKMAVEDTTSVSNISMSELTLDEVHYHVDPSVYQTSVRASILVTSLVVHSVFEGLAIGLQMKTTEVWALFIAIGVHKAAVSFCLGSHLVESYKEFRSLVAAIIIFSFTTSICVAIGTVITEAVGSGGIVDTAAGVLLAVATGSFLYITFCEILQKELSKARDSTLGGQVIRTFALLAGFGVCAGICVLNH